MTKILVPIVALALLITAVLVMEDERPRADVVFVHGTDLFTLDPQRMSYLHDLRAASAIYEPLAAIAPDGHVIPAAADSWEISDDGLIYTFHLRDALKFSNGDPVTADDFVYAWRRAILPDTAAVYSGLFFPIKGARAFFDWRNELLKLKSGGEADPRLISPEEAARLAELSGLEAHQETLDRFDQQVGIKALDAQTLEVRLEEPLPYFLDLAAFGTFSPIHRKSLQAMTTIDPSTGRIKEDPAWLVPGALIGNGPYVLERWRYKRDARFERNPHFWNAENVANDSLEAVVIEDPNTAILAFEAGEVDWLPDVTADYRADMIEQRASYEARHQEELSRQLQEGRDIDEALAALPDPESGERRNIHILDSFGTDYFQVNCRKTLADGRNNPLAEPALRRALALSIDKKAIVERVTRLREKISNSLVPAGSIAGYDVPEGLPHDPERARQELASAGWTLRDGVLVNEAGDPFPTLIILYSTGSPRYKDISLALRDMWRRELGMSVEIEGKAGNEYRAKVEAGDFMVARGGWYGDYGDPTTFLDLSRTGDGNNHRGFSDPSFDALLDEAARERDPGRRMEILAKAERILVEEQLPLLPLCTYAHLYMYEPGVFTGLTHHPRLTQYPHRLKMTHAEE